MVGNDYNVVQVIAAHRAINDAERNNRNEPDATYIREWRKFCAFVDEHRANGQLPQALVYAERHAIDLYFTSIVAHDKHQPESVQCIVAVIGWYARNRENVVIEVNNGENSNVARSVATQATRYMQQYLDENDRDAHQGVPTSILSYEEHEKVVRHVFTSNLTCWPDFLLLWNGCTATYLRNDSMRKLNFEDIHWDASHGPIFDGNQPGDHCLISFILQPYTHKDDEDQRNQHNNNHSEAP